MKRVRRSESAQIWRERIEAARSFGGSVSSYCEANNISIKSFYNWRRRFAAEGDKSRSSFVSAVVRAERPVVVSRTELPEAKWVAEVVAHFVRSFEA